MKNIISEYSETLYHALVCLISIIIMLMGIRMVVKNDNTPLKTVAYNSDSYDKNQAPIINIKKNMVIINKGDPGYENENEILNTLQNKDIFDVTLNGQSYTEYNTEKNEDEQIRVNTRGVVNSSKEGTYNIEIVATNKYSTSTSGVTIMVRDSNRDY